MDKKEIIRFFERLSEEDNKYKLTTDRIIKVIRESNFSDEVKAHLCNNVDSHVHCEFDDLEVNPFVVSNYGSVVSLECENCNTVIISSDTLS